MEESSAEELQRALTSTLYKEIQKTNDILQDVLIMVKGHETYISDSKKWRSTVVGLVVTVMFQIVGSVYFAGQFSEKLDNVDKKALRNEMRLDEKDKDFREFLREGRAYYRNSAVQQDDDVVHKSR